jgi:predicted 3-demethylubiquinone-9 3-methyltransferase (glyoxalase superfamily)
MPGRRDSPERPGIAAAPGNNAVEHVMRTQQKITPCLWFATEAAEAARFYVSIFPDAYIAHQATSTVDWPGGKAGDVVLVEFVLAGQRYQALNGGVNEYGVFNDSVSLSVACEDQAEVDRYWDALIAEGGEPILCGWLKDRYGLRWQIVPRAFIAMMMDPNQDKARRAMAAMMQMVKLDVAKLQAAFDGKTQTQDPTPEEEKPHEIY